MTPSEADIERAAKAVDIVERLRVSAPKTPHPLQRKQTRKASLVETLLNTALGYGVALIAQIVVFPWFGIHVPLSSNIMIGAIFTIVSIARGFILRRAFETMRVRGMLP